MVDGTAIGVVYLQFDFSWSLPTDGGYTTAGRALGISDWCSQCRVLEL